MRRPAHRGRNRGKRRDRAARWARGRVASTGPGGLGVGERAGSAMLTANTPAGIGFKEFIQMHSLLIRSCLHSHDSLLVHLEVGDVSPPSRTSLLLINERLTCTCFHSVRRRGGDSAFFNAAASALEAAERRSGVSESDRPTAATTDGNGRDFGNGDAADGNSEPLDFRRAAVERLGSVLEGAVRVSRGSLRCFDDSILAVSANLSCLYDSPYFNNRRDIETVGCMCTLSR
jgi:hypothetical protein